MINSERTRVKCFVFAPKWLKKLYGTKSGVTPEYKKAVTILIEDQDDEELEAPSS